MKKSPLFIIFSTVLLDLVGFGMVIPLVSIYGRHYGASGWQLALLGAVFSLMQFLFAPFWGTMSDRVGRRPVLLVSLAGSTFSYFLFGLAPDFTWLFVSRALAGAFAANISAAQAYIADVTSPKDRAKGMGLIGAAFGIGFTIGPPVGGITSHYFGLSAPGLLAGTICGLNLLLAWFRLPESLAPELRNKGRKRSLAPLPLSSIRSAMRHPTLWLLFLIFFGWTFAFSTIEQTIALLLQARFSFSTEDAALRTGWVLMWSGLIGALIQGGLIRKLVPRFGERKLLWFGLALSALGFAVFPWGPTYPSYYGLILLMTAGSAILSPSLSALISKNAGPSEQGTTMGLSQGLGSLARTLGPFFGLMAFAADIRAPFLVAAVIAGALALWSLLAKLSPSEELPPWPGR